AIERLRIGQGNDLDARREVHPDRSRAVRRGLAVAELTVAGHAPGPDLPGRGQRVTVRVRRRDLHDVPSDAAHHRWRAELELRDLALVSDDAEPVYRAARCVMAR